MVLAGCWQGVGPEPFEAEKYEALPSYSVWWAEAKACTGRPEADLRRVQFFRVTKPLSPSRKQFPCLDDGTMCSGFWEEPHDIYLADGVTGTKWFVKHEMLHDLLQSTVEVRVQSCLRTRLPFALDPLPRAGGE